MRAAGGHRLVAAGSDHVGEPIDVIGFGIGVLSQLVLVRVVYLPLEAFWPDTFTEDRLQENARSLVDRADLGQVERRRDPVTFLAQREVGLDLVLGDQQPPGAQRAGCGRDQQGGPRPGQSSGAPRQHHHRGRRDRGGRPFPRAGR